MRKKNRMHRVLAAALAAIGLLTLAFPAKIQALGPAEVTVAVVENDVKV